MQTSIFAAAALAGFIYAVTPGPGFLAVFGIGAAQGRRAGAAFLGGHLAGDTVWSTVSLVAIIGVNAIGPLVFDLLGLVSGVYLFWLGFRAVRVRRRQASEQAPVIGRPALHGLVFGLTNPKAYPVAVATFTALLSSRSAELTWPMLPALVLASLAGGLAGYVLLIAAVGAPAVRKGYRRHEVLVTRLSGVMFMGFAANALFHAAPGLVGRRT